jgi:hypothetical protein
MANEAGWNPDPTGRHEYRYWDGDRWTDQVADGGVAGSDPLPGGDPTVVGAAAPHDPTLTGAPVAGAPTGAAPAAGGDPSGDRGSKRGLLIGAAIAAVIIIAGGLFLLLRDDDGGETQQASTTPTSVDEAEDESTDTDGADETTDGSEETTDGTTDDDIFDDGTDLGDSEDFEDITDFGDPDAMADMIADLYQDMLGLTAEQAECLADEVVSLMGDDGDFDQNDPAAMETVFEAFDNCGISMSDLGTDGGFGPPGG